MKLLDAFLEQVQELGALKRAWFTTFNLSIPFFETHVLPALLDADKPTNRMDYENMQLLLAERGIDVRVFCDLRAMEADQLKRTAVPVHGVLPGRLEWEGFDKESLFHPKVVFLEDEKGRMVLGAGSANLTISGWGRNQEVFTFRAVSNNGQYQQVINFFKPLLASTDLEMAQVFGVRRRFDGRDENWRFVHSFEKPTFLEYLLEGTKANWLTVWSPYFARDLAGLLERIRQGSGSELKFSIVPDRVGNRYLRTMWSKQIGDLMEKGALSFHDRPSLRPQEIELTHAKLWLASGRDRARLAIGSWNCTEPGTSSFELRNVEAGILLDVEPTLKIAGERLALTSKNFGSEEMLKEDELELLIEPPPFELQVRFDWDQGRYKVEGRLFVAEDGKVCDLRLPGVKKPEPLRWKERRSKGAWPLEAIVLEVIDNEALLADHCYGVWSNGNLVYRGLIQEINPRHRRAQGYDSLNELLNDLVNDVSPESSGTARLRKALRHDDVPDDEPALPAVAVEGGGLTYFRLFYAFEQFRKRLRVVSSMDELEKILFVYPGSLQELVAKVDELVAATGNTVFNWFLLKEVGSLHVEAHKKWDGRRKKPEKWKSLKPRKRSVTLPPEIRGNALYMRQLSEVCDYES
jgi:hypothetical protein